MLLLVDLINPLQFDGAARLAPAALRAAAAVAALQRDARRQGVPSIYVNDNFGHWHADFRQLVVTAGAGRARPRASPACWRRGRRT